jgi:hypothetical protein
MNKREHILEAERLLEAAKQVARRAKETAEDRKADVLIVQELLDFSGTHAFIAQAIGDDLRVSLEDY